MNTKSKLGPVKPAERIERVFQQQIATFRKEVGRDQARTVDWLWNDAFSPLALREYSAYLMRFIPRHHPDLRVGPLYYLDEVKKQIIKHRRCLYYRDLLVMAETMGTTRRTVATNPEP